MIKSGINYTTILLFNFPHIFREISISFRSFAQVIRKLFPFVFLFLQNAQFCQNTKIYIFGMFYKRFIKEIFFKHHSYIVTNEMSTADYKYKNQLLQIIPQIAKCCYFLKNYKFSQHFEFMKTYYIQKVFLIYSLSSSYMCF